MASGVAQATQIGIACTVAWPLGINVASFSSLDPEHPLSSVVTGVHEHQHRCGCGRSMDADMALGSSPGLDVTMALGGKQASHITLLLTAPTTLQKT